MPWLTEFILNSKAMQFILRGKMHTPLKHPIEIESKKNGKGYLLQASILPLVVKAYILLWIQLP